VIGPSRAFRVLREASRVSGSLEHLRHREPSGTLDDHSGSIVMYGGVVHDCDM
jgi:hypothetical protein